MAFQGNHSTFSVPDLLGFILQHKLTGVLVLVSRLRERSFFFRRGELVYALTNDPDLLLGELLVQELDVDRAALEHALGQVGAGDYLGETLVDQGIVPREDLNEVVVRQVRRALREVLRWDTWAFHFSGMESGEELPSHHQCTRSLVFDLIREMDEWDSLHDIFPDLDHLIERKPGSVRSSRPSAWPRGLPSPGRILTQIEGTRTIRMLLEESAFPVRAYAIGLSQLVDIGALHVIENEPGPDASQERSASYPMAVSAGMAARILKRLDSWAESDARICELILSDPVLTARALGTVALRSRIWPSPFSMMRVVSEVGRNTLRRVLIAEAIRGLYLYPDLASSHRLWEESFVSSRAARCIAESIDDADPELAQVAALLQNLGSLVLAADHGETYSRFADWAHHAADKSQLLPAERETFSTTHCAVGAQVAESWNLPVGVKMVIREHHSSLEHPRNQLLAIVRLANSVAESQHQERYTLAKTDRRIAKRLGVSVSELEGFRNAILHSPHHLRPVTSEMAVF